MKKLLLAIFYVLVMNCAAIAQNNNTVSKVAFVQNCNDLNSHISNSQLQAATNDLTQLKQALKANIDATRDRLATVMTKTDRDLLKADLRKKNILLSDVEILGNSIVANKDALRQKFDEFAAIY
jgi:vacuolar-type H+-ATPase subunit E/Vma4